MTLPILRVRPEGLTYPYSVAQFRQDEPQLSISDAPHAAELASYAELQPPILVCRPEPTDPPEHDPATHRAVEVLPVQAPDGTWRQAWTLDAITPPPPVADWLTFKAAVLRSTTVNQALAAAYQVAPVAAAALAPSLSMAERGNSDEFAVVWGAIIQACSVPPAELVGLAALAEACNLPASFVEAINPPAGMVRARDEAGRFIADDPATPENEAWVAAP